ncbi:UNVERIFIED_CONTAM: hypothetical protein FKN15_077828 [Acipenser sinensis]
MAAAFKAINNTPGIIIWRIEKMDLAPVPQKAYGSFFEGDCYILLSTMKSGNTFTYDIHYWIGLESSLDEQGSAAIYTTQLDDHLGGSPVQHREVQGHESDCFRGYFKQGIIYKKGGVASGMKHVETNSYDVKRLLHVKGKRNVTAKEKMDLAPVPQKAYGSFFEGDCYILLSTMKSGNTFTYDIHYWIGLESSLDEQGSAAIYTTQLDDHLGGSPVQHREVQGHESDCFRGYFKQGIIYKKGGVASGMKHVETNSYDVKRLLHVKGKRNVTAKEVEMSWSSFNLGDVFLLDIGKAIIQWNGPESNRQERLKGMQLAKDIRDRERGGRAEIRVVEGDEEGKSAELMAALNSVLGERAGSLPPGTSDEQADQQQKANVTLYQ